MIDGTTCFANILHSKDSFINEINQTNMRAERKTQSHSGSENDSSVCHYDLNIYRRLAMSILADAQIEMIVCVASAYAQTN